MKGDGYILLRSSSDDLEPTGADNTFCRYCSACICVVSCAVHAKPDGYQGVFEEAASVELSL